MFLRGLRATLPECHVQAPACFAASAAPLPASTSLKLTATSGWPSVHRLRRAVYVWVRPPSHGMSACSHTLMTSESPLSMFPPSGLACGTKYRQCFVLLPGLGHATIPPHGLGLINPPGWQLQLSPTTSHRGPSFRSPVVPVRFLFVRRCYFSSLFSPLDLLRITRVCARTSSRLLDEATFALCSRLPVCKLRRCWSPLLASNLSRY